MGESFSLTRNHTKRKRVLGFWPKCLRPNFQPFRLAPFELFQLRPLRSRLDLTLNQKVKIEILSSGAGLWAPAFRKNRESYEARKTTLKITHGRPRGKNFWTPLR